MKDRVFEGFLQKQYEEGMALAGSSDLLELVPMPGDPPRSYVAVFRCEGLVALARDQIVPANHFEVGVHFPSDYQRRVDPGRVLTWLGPPNVFHPNIGPPWICVGRLDPGTWLVDLLYQIFEIITYTKVTMREDDALNSFACSWARKHQEQLPVDHRPLKRRPLELNLEPVGGAPL